MKRKDLVVGLDVAVKDGRDVRRGVILELDTQWSFNFPDCNYKLKPFLESSCVAIAAQRLNGEWYPAVVEGREILKSWAEHEAQQQRESDERDLRDREQAQQRNSYEKLRSRCAELLGCGVASSRLGYAEVALNDLYAVACRAKGQKE